MNGRYRRHSGHCSALARNGSVANDPNRYSQVVEVRGGRIIFIAGQTALDRNGEVVGKANFAQQAAQVFQNLNIALQSVGCTAANLIKLTVFLRNMDNLSAYREARN